MNMEGHELLGKMNKVKAPADFDARVFAKLGEAKAAHARRKTAFRYAFAGSAAVFVVGIVLLNVFVLNNTSSRTLAGKGKFEGLANQASFSGRLRNGAARTYLPVLETVDYSNEYRNVSNQPRTVYILEQVSEVRPTEIKY
jgi:hypothetical protein